MPPLRDRGSGITLLVGYFAEKSRIKLGASSIRITPEAITLLNAYLWPGNIRELEHVISRAAVLSRAQSIDSDLTLSTSYFSIQKETNSKELAPQATETMNLEYSKGLRSATDEFQAKLIQKTYQEHQQNWAATARALQVDTGNLHRLAKRLNLKE